MKMTSALNVFLNGSLVGALHRQSSGAVYFQYAPSWLENANSIPVSLSMPLQEKKYIGAPVMNVFDNLLPDHADLRQHIAERIGAQSSGTYDLLSMIGRDCVGALQFLPPDENPEGTGKVEGIRVTDADIRNTLEHLGSAPLGLRREDAFRISLAGAQEKTAFLRWNGAWHKPFGTTATTHIFKPEIRNIGGSGGFPDSVENEYLCLKICAAFGLPVADAEMMVFEGKKTLVVERFDREWIDDGRLIRVPQEDMCQALSLPSSRKYQSDKGPGIKEITTFLRGSVMPQEDISLFLKVQVLFWLMSATDGHAKNFSIFIHTKGNFFMTPLYDVLSIQPLFDGGKLDKNRMKLAMSWGKGRHYVLHTLTYRHFIETAKESGVGEKVMDGILEEISADLLKALEDVMARLPLDFPPVLMESVFTAMRQRHKYLQDGFVAGT